MKKYNDLYTNEYEKLDKNCPLPEYPFPAFKRDSYICLNGIWKHKITKNELDLNNINDDILVPFPIESKASLVQKRLNKGECRAESSSVFINLANNLERVGDHLYFIAQSSKEI